MLKKISAQKARQNFGEMMDEVRLRGDRYIVNRGDKPLVAVIPVEEYLAWEQARERLYSRIVHCATVCAERTQRRSKATSGRPSRQWAEARTPRDPMWRVVLDYGVITSALLNPHGSPARLLDFALQGRLRLFATPRMVTVISRALRSDALKQRHGMTDRELSRFLTELPVLFCLVPGVDSSRPKAPYKHRIGTGFVRGAEPRRFPGDLARPGRGHGRAGRNAYSYGRPASKAGRP